MDRVIVTGGAGFIGSAIVKELQLSGYEVFVVDNLSFGNRKFIPAVSDNNFFEIDILNSGDLSLCFRKIEPSFVIHLAAIHFIPFCNEHPFLATKINVQGTLNVLDACRNLTNLKKFLFASTAAVYPIMDEQISEDIEPAPGDIYGLSKSIGEQLVRDFQVRTHVSSIICRFFNAFGPNETNPHLIPSIEKQILEGNTVIRVGNLEPKRDYIYTADMAQAVRMLLEIETGNNEIFNLGMGEEFSVLEVIKAFEVNLKMPVKIEQDPSRMRKVDRRHLVADITKLKNRINWKPRVSLVEGIRYLIQNSEYNSNWKEASAKTEL